LILLWHTTQIDFIMAYTQAPINKPVYMHLPPGIDLPNMSKDTHCLQILNNIYGGKDSGCIWFQHLQSKLIDVLHFQQSAFDEYIFYHGHTIFIIYTDDGILIDPCQDTIN
jgi:Reverse transcriptase (RNA-dependent DNA polymerase)